MARNIKSLSVFVASPSDVSDERVRLEEVIRELNITWSTQLGIQLDLIRWETHAFPGFGDDAQDVINSQIINDYDLFIGIMWCRYGAATHRAGSGTIEEFEIAKARFDVQPSSVKLMLYFKDAPIEPSKLDLAQYAKVSEFRSSVGKEGGLYWMFSTVEHFEKLLRMHLSRQVQNWIKENDQLLSHTLTVISPSTISQTNLIPFDLEDEGIVDLMEQFEDHMETMTEISNRIVEATEELNFKINSRTNEINEAKIGAVSGNVSRSVAKRLISNAAMDMDQYAVRMEAEVPAFGAAILAGMNALIKAMNMSFDEQTGNNTQEDIDNSRFMIETWKTAIQTSEEAMTGFRNNVTQLPRLTSELNKAKRNVAQVLDELILEFQTAHSLVYEAETTIEKAAQNRAIIEGE
jgi:hypothetical protein